MASFHPLWLGSKLSGSRWLYNPFKFFCVFKNQYHLSHSTTVRNIQEKNESIVKMLEQIHYSRLTTLDQTNGL